MPDVPAPLPRAAVLREITDGTVLDQVFARGRVTRAELAEASGLSKPTVSESVRRLTEAGVLAETGSRTGVRGRVATYYDIAPQAGWVLALELHQGGIHSEAADLQGRTLAVGHAPPGATSAAFAAQLRRHVEGQLELGRDRGELRVVSVSVANPVDLTSGRVVDLPTSPFPEGVDPQAVLAGLVTAEVLLDNDVVLAARAERSAGAAAGVSSFGYLYVGGGLGFALQTGDHVLRGARGLAGEIGLLPVDPSGTTLTQRLVEQGFGRPDGRSLDVPAVRGLLDDGPDERVATFCTPLAGAVAAIWALTDPELLLMGGPLGRHPRLVAGLRAAVQDRYPLPIRIEAGAVETSPSLAGALDRGVTQARRQLLSER